MPKAAILVVDDEKNILSRALRVEDFDVDVAGSAEIALEKVRTRAYDAFLVDVNMPGMDGLSMIRALRDAHVEAPVLVMSGRSRASGLIGESAPMSLPAPRAPA
jgi:DNA-binding response OmpR family regulator